MLAQEAAQQEAMSPAALRRQAKASKVAQGSSSSKLTELFRRTTSVFASLVIALCGIFKATAFNLALRCGLHKWKQTPVSRAKRVM